MVVACASCDGATNLTGTTATLRWDTVTTGDQTAMTIGGTRYRDGYTVVSLTPSSSTTLEVVNRVRLHDEYLDYLREMPWSWPVEALKAQAAAARGYALRNYQAGIRSACACHVYDTTSDQVYGGYPSADDLPYWGGWRTAVRPPGGRSTGYVVRDDGVVIQAYYSSSHGGRSENNEDVWGGTPLPYLRGVSDPWSLRPSNPRASWMLTKSGSTVAGAFGLADIARLDLRGRTVNGGVGRATATSTAGATATITGEQLRTRTGIYSIAVRHLTQRFGGDDRYAVGAAVARSVAPSATSVVLAAGDSSMVNAAVSGPLVGTLRGPAAPHPPRVAGRADRGRAEPARLHRAHGLCRRGHRRGVRRGGLEPAGPRSQRRPGGRLRPLRHLRGRGEADRRPPHRHGHRRRRGRRASPTHSAPRVPRRRPRNRSC